MPLYEYECLNCGKRTEVLQKMSDAPLATCPNCGGAVKKLLSAPAVQFKGSGWYVTDYAGKKGGSSSSKTESKGDSGTSESGKSEKADKPAAAAETKSSGSSGSSE